LIEILPSIESKEILKFFTIPKNIIYFLEPNELKKLDLNKLNIPPKKIIFIDKSQIIKPSLIHIDQISLSNNNNNNNNSKYNINSNNSINNNDEDNLIKEEFICIFMKSETNQLYIDISAIVNSNDNNNNNNNSNEENDIIINPIFLKNFEDFECVQNIYFTYYKDKNKKDILGLFILCSKIGYYYRIEIKKMSEIRDTLENKFNKNKYKVIYKIDENYLNFFSGFEFDINDKKKKPINLLLGNENFIFELINLEYLYDYDNNKNFYNNISNKKSEETLKIQKPNKEKNIELNKIEEVTEINDIYNDTENAVRSNTRSQKTIEEKTESSVRNTINSNKISNENYNENQEKENLNYKNNKYFNEYENEYNNNENENEFNYNNNDNYNYNNNENENDNENDDDNDIYNENEEIFNYNSNVNNEIISRKKENQKIYLQEYVLSYITKNKLKIGKSKLKADDFKSCYIKKEIIFFFFKNYIYSFDLKSNVIPSIFSLGLTENIMDEFFWVEEEPGEKYFQKCYVLFNRNLHLFQYQIMNYNINATKQIENNKIGNTEIIRQMIRDQKLVNKIKIIKNLKEKNYKILNI
jgi:hypothetical protein